MTIVESVHQATGSLGNRRVSGWYRLKLAENARYFRKSKRLREYANRLIGKARRTNKLTP